MTKQDITAIERIVRQQSLDGNNPDEVRFETWLGVDQQQFLELIDHIPNRAPCPPLSNWWAELHPCAAPDCPVSVGKSETFCYEHSREALGVQA